MEAAAWADPQSQLWEQGQKGIFVLTKAQLSRTGLTGIAKSAFPPKQPFGGVRLLNQKCAAENLPVLALIFNPLKGVWLSATARAESPTHICSHSSINYPHTP